MVGGPAGWRKIGYDPLIADWAAAAGAVAVPALQATDQPLRCGGTWAVGLELLHNAADGAVDGVAFPWNALPLAPMALHRGQLSAIYPGYPQPWQGESDAGLRFRQTRDAAHLDGLLAVGPKLRRMIREPHAWILGLPLTDCAAAPLVVYEGSHVLIQTAFHHFLAAQAGDWGDVDLTEIYKATRAQVFASCRRVEIPVRPGEATLLHRLTVHGVAPWDAAENGPDAGRIIAYFRPMLASVRDWVLAD